MAAASASDHDGVDPAAVVASVGKGKVRVPLRYCVAVDGSELSLRTFRAAASLRNKGDHVTVLHVADPAKDYLPYDMRPSSIREQFDVECVGQFPKSQYSIVVKTKRLGQPTREAVLNAVNEASIDVFCVGMVGRKGPKDDPTILGSTADYSMRSAHCSTCIIKGRGHDFPDAKVFVVACDGSRKSLFCIRQTMSMANASDTIKIVHVAASDQDSLPRAGRAASVRAAALAVIAGDERCSYDELPEDRDDSIAEVLAEHTASLGATFVAMGADGVAAFAAGKKVGLGSVSDRLVKISRASVIITQDSDRLLSS